MNDIEAMKRREVVFDQLRVAKSELAATSEKAMEIRRELSSKQDTVEVLTKLVNTMLSHDCCPLEAKLKYPEEIELNRNAGEQMALAPSSTYRGGSIR